MDEMRFLKTTRRGRRQKTRWKVPRCNGLSCVSQSIWVSGNQHATERSVWSEGYENPHRRVSTGDIRANVLPSYSASPVPKNRRKEQKNVIKGSRFVPIFKILFLTEYRSKRMLGTLGIHAKQPQRGPPGPSGASNVTRRSAREDRTCSAAGLLGPTGQCSCSLVSFWIFLLLFILS